MHRWIDEDANPASTVRYLLTVSCRKST